MCYVCTSHPRMSPGRLHLLSGLACHAVDSPHQDSDQLYVFCSAVACKKQSSECVEQIDSSSQTCFWCVHMYILYACVYICVCVYVCGHDICIYMHVCMDLYIYAFIHVCMCMCMHICAYIVSLGISASACGRCHACACVFVCLCMRIHTCVGMYICTFFLQ